MMLFRLKALLTLPIIAGLEYWVLLGFNFMLKNTDYRFFLENDKFTD